jgi:hypothetical protein
MAPLEHQFCSFIDIGIGCYLDISISSLFLFENGIAMDYCESKDLLRIGELEA